MEMPMEAEVMSLSILLRQRIKNWELQPNNKYKLRYRIFMYDGEMTKDVADRLWNDYAYPPQVIVK
jgi:hypothetical protein